MHDTYDIFCDASVDKSLRGACPGCFVVNRNSKLSYFNYKIQPEGTNNSGEYEAIALGISAARELNEAFYMHRKEGITEPPVFNIFSDSFITIKSITDWIFNWRIRSDGVICKKNGEEVLNQIFLKLIINTICIHNLKINFWHQKGHVGSKLNEARMVFHNSNGIFVESLGIDIEYISDMNDKIDCLTRDRIFCYMNTDRSSFKQSDISDMYKCRHDFIRICFDPKFGICGINTDYYRSLIHK